MLQNPLKEDTKYIIFWIKKNSLGWFRDFLAVGCPPVGIWDDFYSHIALSGCIYIADVQRFWMLSQGVTTSLTLGTPPAAESPTVPQSTPTIQSPTPSHQRPTKDRWLEHQVSQKFMLSCENYDHATRVLKCFNIRRHDDQHIFDQI